MVFRNVVWPLLFVDTMFTNMFERSNGNGCNKYTNSSENFVRIINKLNQLSKHYKGWESFVSQWGTLSQLGLVEHKL